MSIDTAVMTDSTQSVDVDDYSQPPSLHWALVLLFTLLFGRIFVMIWILHQAAWVRRIDPSSNALRILAVAYTCTAVIAIMSFFWGVGETVLMLAMALVRLGLGVALIWSCLSMRQSIEARFNLNLSGLLTFFFPVCYLQYHMTRIAKGEHTPERHGLFS